MTTVITSRDTVNYSFTNTTDDWAFEWTSMSLDMIGTVPEPSQALLMLAGALLVGRRIRNRRGPQAQIHDTCDGRRKAP